MMGTAYANSVVAPPTVTKTASPTNIAVAGSGSNEYTTITLAITGAGSNITTSVPLDIVFAIDSSGSMYSNDRYNLRLAAAKDFTDKMDSTKDTAAVVSWDSNIDFFEVLTSDFTHIKNRIDDVDRSGGTNLNVGLAKSIDLLDLNPRNEASAEVIIFLSDGQGSYSHATAQLAADHGYKIYSIGLGGSAPDADLIDMADTTGGKFYSAPSAENLDAIYQDIYSEVATSTIPHYVNVIEVTQDYIVVDESSFSIAPDSVITDTSGNTVITWNNIGMADSNSDMSNDETVVLSFEAKCSQIGTNLPVDVLGDAKVCYKDIEGNDAGCVDIPQAYIYVGTTDDPTNEEIPEFPTIAIPMLAIIGLAFVFSKRE
jgi:Ca-activated chloride channel family protein